jgi:hypothetical protein
LNLSHFFFFLKARECKNCSSPSTAIKFAKILENAWVKMASSRLALPFLRPLIPAVNEELWTKHETPTENKESNNNITVESSLDLLRILEHIHALKYHTMQEFENDLLLLRSKIHRKLYNWLNYVKSSEEEIEGKQPSSSAGSSSSVGLSKTRGKKHNTHQSNHSGTHGVQEQPQKVEESVEETVKSHDLTKVFYLSFETILESARSFLENKELLLQEIEEEKRIALAESSENHASPIGISASKKRAPKGKGANRSTTPPNVKKRKSPRTSKGNEEEEENEEEENDENEAGNSKMLGVEKEDDETETGSTEQNDSIVNNGNELSQEKIDVSNDSVMMIDNLDNTVEMEEDELEGGKPKSGNHLNNEETEKNYEEVLLEKFWRIYCHKDPAKSGEKVFPLHSQPGAVTATGNTSSNSDEEEISELSSFTQLYYYLNNFLPDNNSSSSSSTGSSQQPTVLITKRSMRSWNEYLSEGMMPAKCISYQLNTLNNNNNNNSSNNNDLLRIRNQLLLNDNAFSKGPLETNETYRKFNFFENQHSKDMIKKLLLFHEFDSSSQEVENQSHSKNNHSENVKQEITEDRQHLVSENEPSIYCLILCCFLMLLFFFFLFSLCLAK